jgi:hypothetical protein
MAQMKHVGRVKNTDRRCVVVFREIYDDRGNVIDEDNCLVFETETLPDAEHQDLMRIVESDLAQTSGDLYNVLARQRLGSGIPALSWLVQSGRLRKFPTNNVELMPDSTTRIGLHTINKIVKMQKTGATEADIQRILQDDTDMPPRKAAEATQILAEVAPEAVTTDSANAQPGDLLNDATIAKGRLEQAEMFERQAAELREQAYQLDPALKPKRVRKPAPRK